MTLRVRANGDFPPRILSTPAAHAIVGEPYRYNAHDQVIAQGTRPLTWALGKRIGGDVVHAPAGMHIDVESGEITWTPSEAQIGPQSVAILAANPAGSALQEFTVDVAQATTSASGGCSTGFGRARRLLGWWTLVLALGFWRTRRHRLRAKH